MCLLIYQQTSVVKLQATVHLKLVLFESLAGKTPLNGARKWRLTAKESSITGCEELEEKHRITVQGIFIGIIIKASGASLKVTDLLFAFAFL